MSQPTLGVFLHLVALLDDRIRFTAGQRHGFENVLVLKRRLLVRLFRVRATGVGGAILVSRRLFRRAHGTSSAALASAFGADERFLAVRRGRTAHVPFHVGQSWTPGACHRKTA